MASATPKTFVLVHGASHGGWCWRYVADRLRDNRHAVTTPTLTGLGERAHLLDSTIDLGTHITDVENHIGYEDLVDIVLVGHSYAGAVISGVADRLPHRISRLIYLDALLMQDGETAMAQLPEGVGDERIRFAARQSGGLVMPVPPAAAFGVTDPGQAAWLESKLTPHPIKTYLTQLRLNSAIGNGLPADYIICTAPLYRGLDAAHARAMQTGWSVHELATGHDAMVIAPMETANLLEAIATSRPS